MIYEKDTVIEGHINDFSQALADKNFQEAHAVVRTLQDMPEYFDTHYMRLSLAKAEQADGEELAAVDQEKWDNLKADNGY